MTKLTEAANDLASNILSLFIDDKYISKAELIYHLRKGRYSVIKTNSQTQCDALEHFCTIELYPLVHDQQSYLIL